MGEPQQRRDQLRSAAAPAAIPRARPLDKTAHSRCRADQRAREGILRDLDRGDHRRCRHHQVRLSSTISPTRANSPAPCSERYVERERVLFDDLFARADELSEDPLHSFLIALKLFAEMFETPAPVASGLPHRRLLLPGPALFDRQIRELNTASVIARRTRFRARLGRHRRGTIRCACLSTSTTWPT